MLRIYYFNPPFLTTDPNSYNSPHGSSSYLLFFFSILPTTVLKLFIRLPIEKSNIAFEVGKVKQKHC